MILKKNFFANFASPYPLKWFKVLIYCELT